MGKNKKIIWSFLLLTALLGSMQKTVRAQSMDDLYTAYGMTSPDALPDEIRNTILNYNNAAIYAVKYEGLSNTASDYTAVQSRIDDYQSQITSSHKALEQGFGLDIETILKLEKHIQYCEDQKRLLAASMDESEILPPSIDNASVPSKAEYLLALEEKKNYTSLSLGDVTNIQMPVTADAAIKNATDKYVTVSTADPASALALFNGTVIETDGDYIKIGHGNTVFTEYYGLSAIQAEAGDELTQYQRIGSVKNQFQLALSINGEYCNLSVLFGGDN